MSRLTKLVRLSPSNMFWIKAKASVSSKPMRACQSVPKHRLRGVTPNGIVVKD